MKDWKVYCYTGKNNKQYIGITSNSLETRAGKNGIHYVKDGYSFGKAIQKYGFDFFTGVVLEDGLTLEEAASREQYYIKLYDTYNNGYNETYGGEGTISTDRPKVYKLWEEGYNLNEIHELTNYGYTAIRNALESFGVTASQRVKRSAGEYLEKSVSQYDINGNYITTYKSLADAEKNTGIPHSNISHCLEGKRQSAGGFQWSVECLEYIPPKGTKRGNHKELYQYTINKELVQIYPSVAEAARITNYQKEYLAKKAAKQEKAYGFIWSYKEL